MKKKSNFSDSSLLVEKPSSPLALNEGGGEGSSTRHNAADPWGGGKTLLHATMQQILVRGRETLRHATMQQILVKVAKDFHTGDNQIPKNYYKWWKKKFFHLYLPGNPRSSKWSVDFQRSKEATLKCGKRRTAKIEGTSSHPLWWCIVFVTPTIPKTLPVMHTLHGSCNFWEAMN